VSSEIVGVAADPESDCGNTPPASPQVARIAVEMLIKEKFAKCALSVLDLLARAICTP